MLYPGYGDGEVEIVDQGAGYLGRSRDCPKNIPPFRSRFENDGLYRGRDCGKTRRCGFCGRRTRTIIIANRASYAQCDAAHERYRYDDSPICEKTRRIAYSHSRYPQDNSGHAYARKRGREDRRWCESSYRIVRHDFAER